MNIINNEAGTINEDSFVSSMMNMFVSKPAPVAVDKPQIKLNTLNKVIRNRQQEALA